MLRLWGAAFYSWKISVLILMRFSLPRENIVTISSKHFISSNLPAFETSHELQLLLAKTPIRTWRYPF